MTRSKWYLILMILDIILLIGWPFAILIAEVANWIIFLVGAVWCSDFYDLHRHYLNYKEAKFYEGFEEV